MFIVLEGINGSGTTTMATALAKALHERTDRRIIVTAEPTEGPIGSIFRQVLQGIVDLPKSELLYLILADRQWHLHKTIRPNLVSDAIVICDRYVYSTWCYQQLTHSKTFVEELITRGRCEVPDLVFVLDAPVTMCLERNEGPEELFEDMTTLKTIRTLYLQLTQDAFRLGHERIFPIDARLSKPEVLETLLAYTQMADETIKI